MRSHAKASSAGSSRGEARDLGRIVGGAIAVRAYGPGLDGSGTSPRRIGIALCAVACVLGLLVFAAPAGAAPPIHHELPALKLTGFERACGLAVDSAGNRYVADGPKTKVNVYTPSGAPITSFATTLNASPCGLAVDSQGDVYVNGLNSEVAKYKPSSFPPTASTAYPPDTSVQSGTGVIVATESPTAVAVDPANDNLYVATAAKGVSTYKPNGEPIATEIGLTATAGAGLAGVAVRGSNGKIYLTTSTTPPKAYVLSANGTKVLAEANAAATKAGSFAPGLPGVAVDQSNGHFYVADIGKAIGGHRVIDEFDSGGEPVSETSTPAALAETNPGTVAVDNSGGENMGDVFVGAGSEAPSSVLAFGPLVPPIHPELPTLNLTSFETAAFQRVCGLAVDSAGNRYVADFTTKKVYVFAPSGTPITSFATTGNAAGPCGLAVDSQGDVYVNGRFTDVVKYKPEGGFPPTSSTIYKADTSVNGTGVLVPSGARGVAVSPASGNVYVATALAGVSTFQPDGTPIATSIGSTATGGAELGGVAVRGSNGKIYLAARGPVPKAYVLSSDGSTVLAETSGSNTKAGSFASGIGIGVDQSNGHFYVADIGGGTGHKVVDEFDSGGEPVSEIPTPATLTEANPSAVVVDSSGGPNGGDVFVSVGSKTPSSVLAFGPLAYISFYELEVIKVGAGKGTVTSSPTGVNCGAKCKFKFEEGTEVTLTASADPGSRLAGWEGCDTEAGDECTVSMSEARKVTASFTTKPAVSGLAATQVSDTTATLNAEVNPAGEETTYRFEYVDDASFQAEGFADATVVPAPEGEAGSGNAAVPVSYAASGLEPFTTYHLRVVATNALGATASTTTTKAGSFGSGYLGIAVDQSSGHFYVADVGPAGGGDRVLGEFNSAGRLVSEIPTPSTLGETDPSAVAVDNSGGANHDDVFASAGQSPSKVLAFGPSTPHPEIAGLGLSGFGRACGLAVDSAGNRYVSDFTTQEVKVYSPSGTLIKSFPTSANATGPCSLAVDSQGDVYVNGRNTDVVKYKPSSFPPTPSTSYAPDTAINGTGVLVSAEANGVAVDPANDDVYLATASSGISTFQPEGAPIATEIGSDVTGGAELGSIAVRGSTGEIYVTVRRSSGNEVLVLSLDGSTILTSTDLTFTTYRGLPGFGSCPNDVFRLGHPSAKLPDCRVYEQATPVEKNGNFARGLEGRVQASLEGDGITTLVKGGLPGGEGTGEYPSFLSTRGPLDWSTQGLLPLPTEFGGYTAAIGGWTPDLRYSFSAVSRFADGVREVALLIRSSADHSVRQITPFTAGGGTISFAGASADDSKLFFEAAGAALTPDAAAGKNNLYLYEPASERLSLVGVLPASEGGAAPTAGSSVSQDTAGRTFIEKLRPISADGDRAYFTSDASNEQRGAGPLYLREGLDGENPRTVMASASRRTDCADHDPCAGAAEPDPVGTAPALLEAATPSGSKAFFTSTEELTDDANTGPPADPAAIGRADIANGGNVDKALVPLPTAQGYGNVARDAEYVYWSDTRTNAIGRAPIDSSGNLTGSAEPDFIGGLDNPQGIAVDGSHLYWTSGVAEAGIFSYRVVFQGKYAHQNVPRMTCTITDEFTPGSHACEVSAERDGGAGVDEQQTLTVSSNTGEPAFLTLTCDGKTTPEITSAFEDVGGGRTDIQEALEATCGAGNFVVLGGAGLGTIGRADLNGSGDATNVDATCIPGASDPRGIDVHAGFAYWLNEASSSLGRADVSGDCATASSSADHTYLPLVGGGGQSRGGGFSELGDLAVDDDSVYYSTYGISTTGEHRANVSRINIDGSGGFGEVIASPPELPNTPTRPPALALDGSHLYYGDFAAGKIGRQDIAGIDEPEAVDTDSHGDLFVASRYGPLDVYAPDGSLITHTFAPYRTASGEVLAVAVDSQGYLYARVGSDAGASDDTGNVPAEVLKLRPSNPGSTPTSATTYSLDTSIGESSPGANDGDGVIDPGPTANSVAVDPTNDDLYVSHYAESETQDIHFSGFAEGDTFTLSGLPAACSSTTTPSISYSTTNSTQWSNIDAALETACSAGANNDFQINGSAEKISVNFQGQFAKGNVSLLGCAKLTGSGNCSVVPDIEGSASYISQYHSAGALVTDTIGSGVSGAQWVGVDVYGANHDVYAADDAHNLAYVFSAAELGGEPAVTIDGSNTPGGSLTFNTNVAHNKGDHIDVDQSNGHLYLLDGAHNVLDEFDPEGAYVSQLSLSSQGHAVAVDDSGGVADGDIYVASQASAVEAYDHSHNPLPALSHSGGYDANPSFVADAPFPAGLALDSGHIFWATGPIIRAVNLGNDLYRFEPGGAGECEEAGGCLADLTPDSGDENGAEAMGVAGISNDGNYVYFAANADLDGGGPAEVGDCTHSFGDDWRGSCSLYLWHGGSTEFITRLDLSGADSANLILGTGTGAGSGAGDGNTARVSADGKTLVFRSQLQQAGYDNHGAVELYRYNTEEGISCISCNPTGAPPSGSVRLSGIAAGALVGTGERLLYRFVSPNGGRAFFETTDKLVVGDVNGDHGCPSLTTGTGGQGLGPAPACQDVYEWEAPETGSCSEASSSYSPSNSGCIYLISSGTGDVPSYFADASASGNDVFIFTTDKLVPQDEDELMDVYDAHVEGGLASQYAATPPPCEGEACRGAGSKAPASQGTGSSSFSGPGDVPQPHLRDCDPAAERAQKLARLAKDLRRRANNVSDQAKADALRRRAAALAKKAHGNSGEARRCRQANRRAAR